MHEISDFEPERGEPVLEFIFAPKRVNHDYYSRPSDQENKNLDVVRLFNIQEDSAWCQTTQLKEVVRGFEPKA